MTSITKDISYVGVQNPNLRVFDVIMRTEYGTTYNSYLIKGSEKTALVEASHKRFGSWLEENVLTALDGRALDYVIFNHTEPDHSGCIAELVARFPDITIICSAAGAIYLKNISNIPDLNLRAVKDGETLSLGDKTLNFIIAPFLHWPDSMFTYVPEEKVLFSCDFLGAHYCEVQVMDYKVAYECKYKESLKYYYDCIFGPFPTYVQSGLKKIEGLDIEIACTSHGPILTRDCYLPEVLKLYKEWSAPKVATQKVIPLFYCTAYGNTQMLAEHIKTGIQNKLPEAKVECYNVIEHDMGVLAEVINSCDAFLLGTLTINRAIVPPILQLISHIEAIGVAKKPVALFGSAGWSGEGFTQVAALLTQYKVKLSEEQLKVTFVPSAADLESAVAYGEKFADSL